MTSTRDIGFAAAVALVMGNMIGSGVFLLPASLAPYGGISIIGWLITATGSVLLALVFARLARIHPAAGGLYAYTRLAFGDLARLPRGLGLLDFRMVGERRAGGRLRRVSRSVLSGSGPQSGRRRRRSDRGALGVDRRQYRRRPRRRRRSRSSRRRSRFSRSCSSASPDWPVLNTSHFTVTVAEGSTFGGSIYAVMTLTLWAFLGLEVATIPAGSIQNPAQTIPRAT